ncbi:MAG: 30S ribosomal protein S6 [Actinomycetota bacterium]|nr:30S ribosomal protein S6 [Actinomycetota bacterium]
MRSYESLFILSPSLTDEQAKAVLSEMEVLINKHGGKVTGIDMWGTRKLEYPIKRQDNGHYAVLKFMAGTEIVPELERSAGMRDEILRVKTLVLKKE